MKCFNPHSRMVPAVKTLLKCEGQLVCVLVSLLSQFKIYTAKVKLLGAYSVSVFEFEFT